VEAPLRLPRGAVPAFDACCIVDWSAASVPTLGPDSVWWSLARWVDREPSLETGNAPTRHAFAAELVAWLRGPLAGLRVLVGFDFPFGYPRGFAAALGHRGRAADAWAAAWQTLGDAVRDDASNANNRFEVAAALNARISGGFGPFFGRPRSAPPAVAAHLSPRQREVFEFPLPTRGGGSLERMRLADRAARTASTPWFVYGGANAVGGQALVGIPHVARLREAIPEARVWPFETGARLPPRGAARVVLAEVYPSLFHVRRPGAEVHDRLQVIATARAFARLDAEGRLAAAFGVPGADPAALHEEGWVLGVP
jgi:precorrin-8X/cobalt-precorrin-8 methylmutase